jgi:hypothetical protein
MADKDEKKEESKTYIVYDEPKEYTRLVVNTKTKEAMDVYQALVIILNKLEKIENSL